MSRKLRSSEPPEEVRFRLRELKRGGFKDDGCTNAPDRWFRSDFVWACILHDAAYCTRWNEPGSMTQRARQLADYELGRHIRGALPWAWRWIGWVYRFHVRLYGGRSAYDSCGPMQLERDPNSGRTTGRWVPLRVCRHGLPQPKWMRKQRQPKWMRELRREATT